MRYMHEESHKLKHSTNMAYQDHRIRWVVPTLGESICEKKTHTPENVLDVHIQLVGIFNKRKKVFIYINFPLCAIYS